MATNQPNHPLGLPPGLSPDALDTLTDLIIHLERLRAPDASSSLPGGVTGQTPAPTPSNSTTGELSLKDMPTATDHLKHKLLKARAQIKTLPDMSRTTAEQEEEMRELEDRIRRQREVLDMLRDKGVKFADRMQE